ncbi:MAG TPA: glycosyltransferase [Polyangia bacterium]|nr:glycosyltransferase [Polyangia bacterium]
MTRTVLYLVDGLGLSGKTKALVDLVAGLDPARYRAVVAYFIEEAGPLPDKLRALGVELVHVPCPDGLNVQILRSLAGLVRRLRPEVIHCYNPRAMLYGGLVARALGVRATLGTLSAFACLTPDGDYRFLPQKLFSTSRRNRLRNRFCCALVRAVVTVSPTLGRNFCRYNGVDARRLRVIGYGVDAQKFARVTADAAAAFRGKHALPADAVVIASVGRLVEQKDYPTQLRAFARAAARVPALHMLLVGDGPLRGELERLVAELGVASRVRFAGHCDDVPTVLRAIDVFCLASKFEPYGVALLEAKAAGCAIVATRVNEVAEILSEGAAGVLVPPEDPDAMGEAFALLAADAPRRRALGAQAAREAAEKHSLQGAIAAYQALYDEIRGVAPHAQEQGAPATL